MKLWRLIRSDTDYSDDYEIVALATTGEGARRLAIERPTEQCEDTEREVWGDPVAVTCQEVDLSVEGIVLVANMGG